MELKYIVIAVAVILAVVVPPIAIAVVSKKFGPTRVKNGVLAIGVLEGVTPTATTINDVRVYNMAIRAIMPNGAEHHGTIRTPIPEHVVHSYQMMPYLPVLVDPNNPTKMGLGGNEHAPQLAEMVHQFKIQRGLAEPDSPELQYRGVTAQGVISRVEPTGRVAYDHVQVLLEIAVTELSGEQIKLAKHIYLPQKLMSTIGVGKFVPEVQYLPHDHSQFSANLSFGG